MSGNSISYIQSNLPMWSPLLSSHLYKNVTFFWSCYRKFDMKLTSFKRSSVLKDHFFFVPKVTSSKTGFTVKSYGV